MRTTVHPHNQIEEEESPLRPLKVTHAPKDQQVSLIRKELVALTGNHFKAIVLNQLLYWAQRVKDLDLWLEEEKNFDPKNPTPPQHGWIYKKANELINETLLRIDRTTMRRYLSFLAQKGWIDQRTNPVHRWDKTTQYRVNLRKIQSDLLVLGLSLPDVYLKELLPEEHLSNTTETSNAHKGQVISFGKKKELSNAHEEPSKDQTTPLNKSNESPNVQNAPSKVHNNHSRVQNAPSNVRNCSFIYLTETTSKNTNKEHTPRTRKSESDLADQTLLSMIELWKKHTGQDTVLLTKKRTKQLQSVLALHFQNDLSKWEEFCKQIKASPFLMGEGPKKWHVSFDWILRKDNVHKVLEGNFDSPEEIQQRKEAKAKIIRQKKTQEILDFIKDPFWREWCSQLSEFPPYGYSQVNRPLYWWQLERITNAQFLNFDERFVVIGSSDPKVLNEIEENRYQLASIVARTFPTSRTIRTELLKEGAESPSDPAFSSKISLLKSLNLNSSTQQEGISHAK